jgi:hypothetical protein
MAYWVLGYTERQIAVARGQIEEFFDADYEGLHGNDKAPSFDDLEISYLDWYARELWKEKASKTLIDAASCEKTVKVTTEKYGRPPGVEEPEEAQRASYSGVVLPHPNLEILLEGQRVITSNADLAFIVLDEPVAGAFSRVLLPDSELQAEERIDIVGYGLVQAGGAFGVRRFGTNQYTRVLEQDGEKIVVERPASSLGNEEQPVLALQGDSGGAGFRESKRGLELAGVVSKYTPGENSTLTSVYFHRVWICREILRAAE